MMSAANKAPYRLIITADDFGAALAVNEAVEIAHTKGILTCASLMVSGAALEDAIMRARRLPELAVGLHIALVDARPVLPPEMLPALVGSDGRFCDSMLKTALAIALFPAARAQMRAEVAAQFAAFAATGLTLDHVNAHKHFHLHPMIAEAILDAGRAYGLPAMRLPRETGGGMMAWWAGMLAQNWTRRGIRLNDRVIGLAASGAFTTQRMCEALSALEPGLTEIYTHPATSGGWPGAATFYRYSDELAALTDPQTLEIVAQRHAAGELVTGSFRAMTR